MKKLILALFALLILSVPALAKDGRTITPARETIPLTANFLTRSGDNVLPYLRYNEMTYIPLDEYHRSLLRLTVSEDENEILLGIDFFSEERDTTEYRPFDPQVTTEVDMKASAYEITKPVWFESMLPAVFQNVQYAGSDSYPFLRFNGVIYMPLEWQCLQRLAMQLDYDGTELKLYADNKFKIINVTNPNSTDFHTVAHYYQIYGKTYAEFVRDTTFYREEISLNIWNGSELITLDGADLPNITTDMHMNSNSLEIMQTVPNSYFVPPHGKSIPSIDGSIYKISINIFTGEIKGKTLVDEIIKDMYGMYVHADGSTYETDNPNYDYRPPTEAYYDGGRVILNGTMMRSYALDGTNIQSSYWIRVEDLENYGYDMVVDFENRATYFYYNVNKPVNPMDLDGTYEHLPIYDSDWKIYIDGKEPKYGYNIGGYTLVYAGELGEYSIDYLEGHFRAMMVTSPINIQFCEIPVRLNYQAINEFFYTDNNGLVWPLFIYRDIVYIPLDSTMSTILGFVAATDDENGIICSVSKNEAPLTEAEYIDLFARNHGKTYKMGPGIGAPTNPNPFYRNPETLPDITSQTAEMLTGKVVLSGIEYDNEELAYPFLEYSQMVYMPLDNNTVSSLGWTFNYDPETGINLTAYDSRFFENSTASEYIVSGNVCVKILTENIVDLVHFLPKNELSIAKDGGDFIKIYKGEYNDTDFVFGHTKQIRDGEDDTREAYVIENIPSYFGRNSGYMYNPHIDLEDNYMYINAASSGYGPEIKNYRLKINLETYEIEVI